MSHEQQQIEAGMAALEAQRPLLGDAVVDASLAGLRARLALLAATAAAAPEPEQALKQVSILFLDVVGSTLLSQQLDPEAVSEVLDDALARGTAIVESFGGKVLQYAGDNILAVFGADEAREDDVERAVHCGLALRALGRVLGAEVRATHGHDGINVRLGLHSGGVLLGGGVDAESSIRGSAVNIAARMEQTAPAGALRISHDAYAQVRGLFDVEVQPPLAVKGVDKPVLSYFVLSAKPRQFRIGTRGIEGVATRMVGRDAEFEILQVAFKRLFAERSFAAITVVSEAGLGKSRLLYEFEAWSEARPESFFLFRGRATPATRTHAFGLLRDVIAWRLQILDDDSVEDARRKLEDGIVPYFLHDDGPELAEGHAHLLGHLIGIAWKDSRHIQGILDDPKQLRNRAFHAAAQLLRRVSARDGSPVILQLEDLHWADSESLDFLNYLAEVNRDMPLLVLGFTRPTLADGRVDQWADGWADGWANERADRPSSGGLHQRIELQPLGKGYSRELANELLQKLPEIPAALRELLISSAEGNPFYMEELVKMLIDQGAISTGPTWSVNAQRLLLTHVPPTLTGVLQARLDGLPAAEKRALQQASVVGAVFWDEALAAIEAQALQVLPALVQRELATPRAAAALDGLRGGVREFAFRHQVLHQVTYDTVLKRHKREGHARVARWLARVCQQGSLRAGDLLGLAAEHFEQAGDEAQAAEFHARAAEQAGERMAHERVLLHAGRGLALLAGLQGGPNPTHRLRLRLLSVRERTLGLQALLEEQLAELDALEQLADELDDDHWRAEVALRRAQRAVRTGDGVTQERTARQAMAWATRVGDNTRRLRAVRLLAAAQVSQGHTEAGRALALQGLAEARTLGLRDLEARLLNTLSLLAAAQGDMVEALDLARPCLQIYRDNGDRVSEAVALSNLGIGWLSLGHLSQARVELEAALRMLRANGDRTMEGFTLSRLSTLALWQGEETRALALARTAVDIGVATRMRHYEALGALSLGEAQLALGRLDAAHQAYLQARTCAQDGPLQHDANAGLARVALAQGDTAAALAELQPLLGAKAVAAALQSTEDPRLIELVVHQALARAGDPRAFTWLARAHSAVLATADALADSALRQGYLDHIPHHRAIIAAWSAWSARQESAAQPG